MMLLRDLVSLLQCMLERAETIVHEFIIIDTIQIIDQRCRTPDKLHDQHNCCYGIYSVAQCSSYRHRLQFLKPGNHACDEKSYQDKLSWKEYEEILHIDGGGMAREQ